MDLLLSEPGEACPSRLYLHPLGTVECHTGHCVCLVQEAWIRPAAFWAFRPIWKHSRPFALQKLFKSSKVHRGHLS